MLQPYAKIVWIIFPPQSTLCTPCWHIRNHFRSFCKCIQNEKLKYHIDIRILTLLVLSWCTFGHHYSTKSFWICCDKLTTPGVSVRLDGDLWWRAIFRSMLSGFKVLGHSVVPKIFLRCLVCVFTVIDWLEGEPLAQSEVLSALNQVFIKDISLLGAVQLFLNPDQLPTPHCWRCPKAWCCHHHALV